MWSCHEPAQQEHSRESDRVVYLCLLYTSVLNIANALDVTVDQLLIASIDHAEVVFLREMEERIRKLPTATKIMACDELSNLLAIIERVHKYGACILL